MPTNFGPLKYCGEEGGNYKYRVESRTSVDETVKSLWNILDGGHSNPLMKNWKKGQAMHNKTSREFKHTVTEALHKRKKVYFYFDRKTGKVATIRVS